MVKTINQCQISAFLIYLCSKRKTAIDFSMMRSMLVFCISETYCIGHRS